MSEVKGILVDRERPLGSGWCGAENCVHPSHKYFSLPARKVKKGKKS